MGFFEQGLVNGLEMGCLYALIALGLCLILGIMKTVNFAHGEFLMLGSFATYYLFTGLGLNYVLSFILAMAILFGFGFGLEKALFRTIRGKMLPGFILTMGLSIFLMNLGYRMFGTKTKSISGVFPGFITVGKVSTPVERVVMSIIAVGLVLLLIYILNRTKIGRAFRAVAQDSDAAQLQGVNIGFISSLSLAFSAALAASAGALVSSVFEISPSIGTKYIGFAFVVVIVGGLGSIPGAVVAGLIVGLVENYVALYLSTPWAQAAVYIMAFLVIVFRPKGILGRD